MRPLDVTAAIGLNQFKRLNKMKMIRSYNRKKIIKSLVGSTKWNNQFNFFNASNKLNPSWFGFPLMINIKNFINKKKYLKYLEKNNIEVRPIISGNFANQPAVKKFNIKFNKKELKNSQEIERRGFFIGLPTRKLKSNQIKLLTQFLLNIDRFK